jgi:hypothetical protein
MWEYTITLVHDSYGLTLYSKKKMFHLCLLVLKSIHFYFLAKDRHVKNEVLPSLMLT